MCDQDMKAIGVTIFTNINIDAHMRSSKGMRGCHSTLLSYITRSIIKSNNESGQKYKQNKKVDFGFLLLPKRLGRDAWKTKYTLLWMMFSSPYRKKTHTRFMTSFKERDLSKMKYLCNWATSGKEERPIEWILNPSQKHASRRQQQQRAARLHFQQPNYISVIIGIK